MRVKSRTLVMRALDLEVDASARASKNWSRRRPTEMVGDPQEAMDKASDASKPGPVAHHSQSRTREKKLKMTDALYAARKERAVVSLAMLGDSTHRNLTFPPRRSGSPRACPYLRTSGACTLSRATGRGIRCMTTSTSASAITMSSWQPA